MSDHREIGRALGLFATHPDVGAGLPMWLADGAIVRAELEKFAAEEAVRAGCQRVYTPVIAKRALYEQSGHWGKFADDMFPPMRVGTEEFVLRPAMCPQHALIYALQQHSYRELPIRIAELGGQFRSELSGVLAGLVRVRQNNLDDCHVFCRLDQIESEVSQALRQILRIYDIFGIELSAFRLSRRDSSHSYLGDVALWERAEDMLRRALKGVGVDFVEAEGEAAFYGPKIDIQVADAAEREISLSTVQLDFNQPERFDLGYVDAEGSIQRPVMIHRGIMSGMERLAAHLIELYDGAFPPWLAPVQLVVLPIAPAHVEAARADVRVEAARAITGVRVEIDDSDESLGLRIRRAHDRRAPYIGIIGDREARDGSISLRMRDGRQLALPVDHAVSEIRRVIDDRSRDLGFSGLE